MAKVIMPKMGDAMEEGTLLRWLKNVGDQVNAGDPIAEIETDKVSLEIEAQESGVLSRQVVAEGAVVPIGAVIATLGDEVLEEAAAAAPVAAAPAAVAAAPAPEPVVAVQAASMATNGHAPSVSPATAAVPAPGERIRASPLVKRLAAEHGIDLNVIPGTGPGGRIVKDDLQPYLTGARPKPTAAAVAAPAFTPTPVPASRGGRTVVPLTKIKKTTGRRMIESVSTAPHFFVTADIEMDAAVAFREQVNRAADATGVKISYNDLVVKACANALRRFPNLNSSIEGDTIVQHHNIDVNLAVALEDGLIAPFIPDTDRQTLGTVSAMAKDLIGRARSGQLLPNEYQGGTFTVSNLGMYDVDEFISIINPPQAAILAVGSIANVPVVRDGAVVPGHRMKITLSADHRVTDGAEVAQFLQAVRMYLEHPVLLAVH